MNIYVDYDDCLCETARYFSELIVEWYDCMNGEKTDPDYHSAIWIPVKKK